LQRTVRLLSATEVVDACAELHYFTEEDSSRELVYAIAMRPAEGRMNVDLRNNKDFLAGLLMIAVGAGGFFMALDYPFGSALRMGPGYFPRVLAGILMTFGVYVLIRGLFTGEKVRGRWGWKPLAFIIVSLVAFGWIMQNYGLIPALVVMFVISTLGGHEFRWLEVLILTVVMSAFAVAVFVYGLGLPYPLWGNY
jgi:hypothetical protein